VPRTLPIDLDAWLPEPQVRTRHRRVARAPVQDLWAAAGAVRLDEARTLGRLVRWRIPGLAPDTRFQAMLAAPPFTLLGEGPTWSVSGLVGKIWTLRHDYPVLADAEAFRSWREPDSVRVLFAHWAEPEPGGGSVLVHEARVAPTDRRAALRLRGLWAVVGAFERFIGAEALVLAADHAEAGARRAPPPRAERDTRPGPQDPAPRSNPASRDTRPSPQDPAPRSNPASRDTPA
jgi:hypothetical protein